MGWNVDGRLRGQRLRQIIVYLAEHNDAWVDPAELIADIWGRPESERARRLLREQIWAINHTVGFDLIEARRDRLGIKILGLRVRRHRIPEFAISGRPKLARHAESGLRIWADYCPDEDRYLIANHATMTFDALAAGLRERFGRSHRTARGVYDRLRALGIDPKPRGWSIDRLAQLLGTQPYRIRKDWMARGLLPAVRMCQKYGQTIAHDDHTHCNFTFTDDDILTFLDSYPWEYDWRAIAPGTKFAAAARAAYNRDPWVSAKEIIRYTRISEHGVRMRFLRGQYPSARKIALGGAWRAPLSEVLAYERRLEANAPRPVADTTESAD